ncbi:hypothetical protein VTN96DRAFT_8312 [Rasamsonia emersonii]
MSPELTDLEPGGESSQYESIRTVTVSPAKERGQLGANEKHTVSEMKILSDYNRGNETLDRDSTVEPAFAGTTTNISGQVNKDLNPESQGNDEETRRSRTAQRYGPGSGVGA